MVNNSTRTNAQKGVRATHLYVKFKPKNSDQYEQLHADTSLSYLDYPIESTVIRRGDYYHDPSLPDSVPTYQYTAVKVDYQFPKGIGYEILDKLYIPEEDGDFLYANGRSTDNFLDKLLNQAYIQTGNYEDTVITPNHEQSTFARKRYFPGGRIRVFDTRLADWIGMEGVRVEARRWFTTHKGYPNYEGYYSMGSSFKRPCNYSIWFATVTFAVRRNLVNTTYWIDGPKITGDWNFDLDNGFRQFSGHIFRGAYRYHAKDIGGLQRPFIGKRQLYIAKDTNKDWSGVNWIALPVIQIPRFKNNGLEYGSDEIFSTTSHETAHSSYVLTMNAGVIQYSQLTRQLQESWPVAVEWFLTHKEYAERGIANYGQWNYLPINPPQFPNRQAFQDWTLNVSERYTSLFINLVDDVNDKTVFPGITGIPDDQVSGYTLPFIEQNILKHSYGLSSLATQLKNNKPSGVTDPQIDLLLSSY